jgi:hypothetical protein
LAVPDWLGPTNPAVRRRPLGVSLPLIAFEVVMAALAIVLTPGIATSGWFAAPTPGTCRGSGTARRPVRAGVAVAAGRVPRLAAFVVLSLIVGQIVTRIGDMLGTPVARWLITALGGVGELTAPPGSSSRLTDLQLRRPRPLSSRT